MAQRLTAGGQDASGSLASTKLPHRMQSLQQANRDFMYFAKSLESVPQLPNSSLKRSDPADGYCITLAKCRVRLPPAIVASTAASRSKLALRYTISLYDATTANFFGRTYRTPRLLPLKQVSGEFVEAGSELVYTLTTLHDPAALLVIEPSVVFIDSNGAPTHEYSLGWCSLAVFAPGRVTQDVSDAAASAAAAAAAAQPLGNGAGAKADGLADTPLYAGSPRAMLLAAQGGGSYTQQAGCGLVFRLQKHSALRRMRHLVADGELFGPLQIIPGLALQRVRKAALLELVDESSASAAAAAASAADGGAKQGGKLHRNPSSFAVEDEDNEDDVVWLPLLCPPSLVAATYLTPALPSLAPRLTLHLKGLRVCLPPAYEQRLLLTISGSRCAEMGVPAMTLGSAHVRIVSRVVTVTVTNGHSLVHKSVVPVSADYVASQDNEAADMQLVLAAMQGGGGGAAARPVAPAAASAAAVLATPGKLAATGSTLLAAEADVLLRNYSPHELMAITFSLEYVIAEPTATAIGVESRLKLPPPAATALTAAADGSAAPAEGQAAASQSPFAGGVFSGTAQLEQRRHVLVATQVFVPCDAPGSTSASTQAGDDRKPPKRQLYFANRPAGAEQSYTRRSLEIPLAAPNPLLRMTDGVWLDGAAPDAVLNNPAPPRFTYGNGNVVIGTNVSWAADTSKEAVIVVSNTPKAAAPSPAPAAAAAAAAAPKPAVAVAATPTPLASNKAQENGVPASSSSASGKPPLPRAGSTGSNSAETPVAASSSTSSNSAAAAATPATAGSSAKTNTPAAASNTSGSGSTSTARTSAVQQDSSLQSPPRASERSSPSVSNAAARARAQSSPSPVSPLTPPHRRRQGNEENDDVDGDGWQSPASVTETSGDFGSGGGGGGGGGELSSRLRATQDIMAHLLSLPVMDDATRRPATMVVHGSLASSLGQYGMPYPYAYPFGYPVTGAARASTGSGLGLTLSGAAATAAAAYAHAPISALDSVFPFPRIPSAHACYGYPLPRADLSRLLRYGLTDAAGPAAAPSSSGNAAAAAAAANPAQEAWNTPSLTPRATSCDVELSDALSAYSVSFTFAAYLPNVPPRTLPGHASSSGSGSDKALDKTALTLGALSTAGGVQHDNSMLLEGEEDAEAEGGLAKPLLPSSLYFAFQFYTAPYVRTEPATLQISSDSTATADEKGELLPTFILSPSSGGHRVRTSTRDPRFLTVTIDCDPTAAGPHERARFVEYLSSASLCIEMWDADSLLPFGTVSVSLSHLMRQQAGKVAGAREYDVISLANASADVNAGAGVGTGGIGITALGATDGGAHSNARPVAGSLTAGEGEVIGRLQLVLASIGRTGSGKYSNTDALVVRPFGDPAATATAAHAPAAMAASVRGLTLPGAGGSGAMAGRGGRSARTKVKVHAQPMATVDPSFAAMLRTASASSAVVSAAGLSSRALGDLAPPAPAAAQAPAAAATGSELSQEESLLLSRIFNGVDGRVDYAAVASFLSDSSVSSLPQEAQRVAYADTSDGALAASTTAAAKGDTLTGVHKTVHIIYTAIKQAAARKASDGASDSAALYDAADAAFEGAQRYVQRKASKGTAEEKADMEDVFTRGAEADVASGQLALSQAEMTVARVCHTLKHSILATRTDSSSAAATAVDTAALLELIEHVYGTAPGAATAAADRDSDTSRQAAAMARIVRWGRLVDRVVKEGAETDAAATAAATKRYLAPPVALLRDKLLAAFSAAGVAVHTASGLAAQFATADRAKRGSITWPAFCRYLADKIGVQVYTGSAAKPRDSLALTATAASSAIAPLVPLAGASSSSSSADDDSALLDAPNEELARDAEVQLVALHREGTKRELVQHLLRDSCTTVYHCFPSFGRAIFLEHTVRNPYRHEERFAVRVDDAEGELRLLTDAGEWQYFRSMLPLACPDAGADSVSGASSWGSGAVWRADNEILLQPGQSVTLPLVYLSFSSAAANAVLEAGDSGVRVSDGSGVAEGTAAATVAAALAAALPDRKIPLSFVSLSHGQTVSLVQVHVHMRPFPVHHTVRYLHSENSYLRTTLPLPPAGHGGRGGHGARDAVLVGATGLALGADDAGRGQHVYCPHPDVVVQVVEGAGLQGAVTAAGHGAAGHGGPFRELRLRARMPAFPGTATYYVLLYDDPYCVQLYQCWRIVAQALLPIDAHCEAGQIAGLEVTVRGPPLPRSVALHTAQPMEIALGPAAPFGVGGTPPFHMVPRALNRMELAVRPLHPGPRSFYVNLVDTDKRELLMAWRIAVNVPAPSITRVYDLKLAPHTVGLKKIPWSSPFDMHRTYTVLSNRPELVRVRQPLLAVEPRATGYIRLAVAAVPPGAVENVLLLVNDEAGNAEETLLLRLQGVGR